MSQLGIDLIKPSLQRILLAMKEDRFTKDELEMLAKWFHAAEVTTRKTLARGEALTAWQPEDCRGTPPRTGE